jgi:hypothetical protein
MTKHQHCADTWLVGLALALVVLVGALGVGQTARAAEAYRLALEAPITVTQNKNTELVAVVRDSQGHPVSGVPVDFRVESGWEKNITLSSQRAVTDQKGEAHTTFQSRMTGVVHITVRAGDSATTAHITVSGAGSTGPGR